MNDPVQDEMRARVGQVLCGKYRVDRLIGTGGMATVFAATHLRNANRVAIKLLHREVAQSADMRTRFLREGYAANTVDHPGTVRVLDDDKTDDGSIVLVMELLDGETLNARLERSHGRLGVSEVLTLIIDALDVLVAAHARGVVHRDIKPENLFLTHEGKVKLLDFGIARLRHTSRVSTGRGIPYGTPAFMAPEQALGRNDSIDARTDLWGIGATAFTLLSGRYVHHCATAGEMIVRAGSAAAPRLASVAPNVPEAVAEVIDRALAFKKEDRWPSARAMRDALLSARNKLVPEEVDEDDRDEHTKVSPPSSTAQTTAQPISIDPPGDPVSSSAGVTAIGERRAWPRGKRLALTVGAAAMVAGALIVVLSAGHLSGPAAALPAAAPAPEPVAPSAPPVEVPAPAVTRPLLSAEGAPNDAPPKESSAAPPPPKPAAPLLVRARSAAVPPAAAPASPPPAKRDPLNPW